MLRQRLLGVGFAAGCSLLAMNAAHAMNGPSNIQIDGGPLGTLQLSGGADGYFYGQTGTSNRNNPGGSAVGTNTTGVNLSSALVGLAKTSGVLQFNIEVGATGGMPTLGYEPSKASVNIYRASPLYQGYVTIAPPGSPVTISAGQFSSLEGYESAVDWNNANIFSSALFSVENTQSVGVEGNFTHGPVSATVLFGDGWDTRVFNFLQASGTYTFNSDNALTVYYAGNLGRTGANALTYSPSYVNYTDSNETVGQAGPQFVNSQMFGAYYSFTRGNLNLVPEVQYVYAKPDHELSGYSAYNIDKYTSDFGAALFGDYTFGTSPFSLGGMAEYFDSVGGQETWFIAPRAEGVGFELTPTWQYKDLFARLSVGYVHLINTGVNTVGPAYNNSGHGRNVLQSALEGGILF